MAKSKIEIIEETKRNTEQMSEFEAIRKKKVNIR